MSACQHSTQERSLEGTSGLGEVGWEEESFCLFQRPENARKGEKNEKKWAPVSFKLRRSGPEKGLMKGYNQFVSEDVSANLSFVHRRAQRGAETVAGFGYPLQGGCTPERKRLSSARERVTAAV